nr:glutathione S-transferase [Paracoccaceae bacterium]
MSYHLIIGDYAYSSWSLRGWLLLDRFGLRYHATVLDFSSRDVERPDAGHWPADPLRRATARTLAAEMHSGFTALRSACPMATRVAYADFEATDAVRADLARIEELW